MRVSDNGATAARSTAIARGISRIFFLAISISAILSSPLFLTVSSPYLAVTKDLISSVERSFYFIFFIRHLFFPEARVARVKDREDHFCKVPLFSLFELSNSISRAINSFSRSSISRIRIVHLTQHVVQGEVVATLSERSKFNEDYRSEM